MVPPSSRRSIPPRLPVAIAPLLVAAVAAAGCGAPEGRHPAIGKAVGPLPIESLADPPLERPEFVGQVTLLNFWGTWCPPCRREIPGLARIAGRLQGDRRFRFVGVSCGPGGPDDRDEIAADTARFLAAAGLRIDAWCDPTGMARMIFADAYGFDAFPTTYLVGPDGAIRRVWSGYRSRDEAEMSAAIVEALKDCPPDPAEGPAADSGERPPDRAAAR